MLSKRRRKIRSASRPIIIRIIIEVREPWLRSKRPAQRIIPLSEIEEFLGSSRLSWPPTDPA